MRAVALRCTEWGAVGLRCIEEVGAVGLRCIEEVGAVGLRCIEGGGGGCSVEVH